MTRRQVLLTFAVVVSLMAAGVMPATADTAVLEVNGPATQLTADDGHYLGSFSPDGSRVVYLAADGIYVMNADGTGNTKIYQGGTRPKWGPSTETYTDGLIALAGTGITVIEPDGTLVKTIDTTHPYPPDPNQTETQTHSLDWSPDGSKIAFATVRGTSAIWTIDFDGTDLLPITDYTHPAYAPAWSPDGTEIACAWGSGSDMSVGIFGADGAGWLRTVGIGGRYGGDYPDWGPNGIVYSAGDAKELHLVNADGTGDRKVSDGPAVMAAWSPDGKRVAYVDGFGKKVWTRSCPYGTIQDALNAADPGDTVNVAAGLYEELVTISKANLALKAEPRDGAVIKPSAERSAWPYGAVLVTADGVTVDGFEVDGTTVCKNGINAYGASGVTITNNRVHGAIADWEGVGIIVWSWDSKTIDNTHIENNEVYNTGRMGIFVMDHDGSQYEVTSGNVIHGNTVHDTWQVGWGDHGGAIQINVGRNSSITDNDVYDTGGDNWGIYMFGSAYGNTISGNTISNNPTGIGLWISGLPDGDPIDWEDSAATSPTVEFNSISGNTVGAQSFGAGVVDAENNWWGDASGPYHLTSNLDGTGDVVSDNVDYDPWLGADIGTVVSEALSGGESVSLVTEEGQPPEAVAVYTGTGTATITLAKYVGNPGESVPGVLGASDAFYDVHVADSTDPDATLTLTIAVGAEAAGRALYWYDGAAWKLVLGTNGAVVTANDQGTYTFTLGPTSSPTLGQLTGTPLGPGEQPQIAVQPAAYVVLMPGDEIAVDIALRASDLYAAEFELNWDATQLETFADNITLGPFLSPDTVIKKEVSGDGTTARIAFTQENPPHPTGISGEGVLATIRFTVEDGAGAGDKALDLGNVKLFDSSGLEIPVAEADILDDVITVSPAANPVPTVTSISPNSATAGSGALLLDVNGTGFVPDSVVQWDGAVLTTLFTNTGKIVALVPESKLMTAGTATVSVVNPTPGGGVSSAATFTINSPGTNPAPTLTGLDPTLAVAGGPGFNFMVTGTNFVEGAVMRWNGNSRPTTYINTAELVAVVAASDIATAGTVIITVLNPAPGGGESDALTFTINAATEPTPNPEPSIASLTPSEVAAGDGPVLLVVNGTGFVEGSVVRWNSEKRATSFVSSTQLVAVIYASDVAMADTADVTVFNPTPGGGESNALTFSINVPPVSNDYNIFLPMMINVAYRWMGK